MPVTPLAPQQFAATLSQLVPLAQAAGRAILPYFQQHALQAWRKADNTPVTLADQAAHQLLVQGLLQQWPQWPVLSEEGDIPPFQQRRNWHTYWLIDPLDGTKEFLAGLPEFTVNIALIQQGQPVLGVVYVPVYQVCYTGAQGLGAFKAEFNTFGLNTDFTPLRSRSLQRAFTAAQPFECLTSRHHPATAGPLEAVLQAEFRHVHWQAMGSSLKTCHIAEGAADAYFRFGPTSEWDTAAAQAILEAAGGQVVNRQGQPLRYNQKPSLLNPAFYALGDANYGWQGVFRALQ